MLLGFNTGRTKRAIIREKLVAGDPLVVEIFHIGSAYLGKAFTLLIDVLNPEAIILGSIYRRSLPLIEPKVIEVRGAEGSFDARSISPMGSDERRDWSVLTRCDVEPRGWAFLFSSILKF